MSGQVQICELALDIKRDTKKKPSRYLIGGGVLLALIVITVGLSRLPTAAPTVDRGTVWVDTVRRGEMVRQVRAPGTLVPERMRLIPAVTAGRVEAIPIRPGTQVTPETVLLELSNPEVELQALEAQRQLAGAEADLVNLRNSLETNRLIQQAAVASVRTEANTAAGNARVAVALDSQRLMSAMEVSQARDRATEMQQRLSIEEERLRLMSSHTRQQLALQAAQVERMRAVARFQQERVHSMRVRAADDGVLQEMSLELGQWVLPGQILARVAQPGQLKAVLRVPETQAKDVAMGQRASIDTRNGVVAGRVIRVDPAVQGGTVAVEVALEGPLPAGARPDLSVDGTIEIERLDDVIHVGRPAYGQPESTVGIFRLEPNGSHAVRVPVTFGRASVNTIEIRSGLQPGDRVIVSDMSQHEAHERVRLN